MLKMVFSLFFNSVLVIQILAHLPLADINMPVNVLQPFQIMISIASFDIFEPLKYINAGFTKLRPWSANFAWLSYDTIVFLLSLGSILIYVIVWAVIIVTSSVMSRLRSRLPCKAVKKFFQVEQVWSGFLTFVHGVFFELAVSAATS